jgi:hypothetical protein
MTDAIRKSSGPPRRPDRLKLAFWLGFAVLSLITASLYDRFLVNIHDPEWAKFQKWDFLFSHAMTSFAALALGPWQFSDRLRAGKPKVHRLIGWLYIPCSIYAGITAGVIAWAHHAPAMTGALQAFEGGLWALVTFIALVFALRREFVLHKLWMMRSYGFTLVFVLGRLPGLIPHWDWRGVPGELVHLSAIVIALLGPDLILATRAGLRRGR